MQTLGSWSRPFPPTHPEMEVSNHLSILGIQARRVLADEGSPLRKRNRRERTKEKVHSSDRWETGEGEQNHQSVLCCRGAGSFPIEGKSIQHRPLNSEKEFSPLSGHSHLHFQGTCIFTTSIAKIIVLVIPGCRLIAGPSTMNTFAPLADGLCHCRPRRKTPCSTVRSMQDVGRCAGPRDPPLRLQHARWFPRHSRHSVNICLRE